MRLISNSLHKFLKKGYGRICILGILSFFTGVVVSVVANVTLSLRLLNPYDSEYIRLYRTLFSTGLLLLNIAFVLFSVSLFYGALAKESYSKKARRSLVIVSGMGIVALLLLNRFLFLYV